VAEGALDIGLLLDKAHTAHERGRGDRGTRVTVADYLIDTSVLARVPLRQNTAEWDDRIAAGLVASCDINELEVLYSARSATDRACLKAALDAHYAWCPMPCRSSWRTQAGSNHSTRLTTTVTPLVVHRQPPWLQAQFNPWLGEREQSCQLAFQVPGQHHPGRATAPPLGTDSPVFGN
jgi:hypothetical protein